MSELASVVAIAYGRVQGVFFRDFASRQAKELGLVGYVRNLPGGGAVEVHAEGKKETLGKLLDWLDTGSPASRVDRVESSWSEYTGAYSEFNIRY